MTCFYVGQYVELYPTIQSDVGGSIDSGTRGIIQDIDESRAEVRLYLVAFLASEKLTGERAWVGGTDLLPA